MKRSVFGWVGVALLAVAFFAVARTALATVRFDGTWPDADKNVALDVDATPRAQALRKLADAAGWSLVLTDAPTDKVDVHVKNQSARKVLEILLGDAAWVAKREGELVAVQRDVTPSAAAIAPPAVPEVPAPPTIPAVVPPPPPAPPAPPSLPSHRHHRDKGQEDKMVTGGTLRIEKDETVHDVSVFGGSVDILGTVTGDVMLFGGKVQIAGGGRVMRDASVVGGLLRVEDGARVDGDVSVIGGSLQRGEHAVIGGDISGTGSDTATSDEHDEEEDQAEGPPPPVRKAIAHAGSFTGGLTKAALLFAFGAIVLALGSKRLEQLRVEVAARPMRSIALGVVGAFVAVVLTVALCVTLIGIPVAIVGVLVGAVALYVGIAAVLTTAGEALLRHKTQNPYIHLAVGCALLFIVGAIPYVGTAVEAAVALCAIGVLVATRAAGVFAKKNGSSGPSWGAPATM